MEGAIKTFNEVIKAKKSKTACMFSCVSQLWAFDLSWNVYRNLEITKRQWKREDRS